MDEESLIEVIHRWNHKPDEKGWLYALYLHEYSDEEKEEYDDIGYFNGGDLRKWEEWRRTATSPSLYKILMERNKA